MLKLSSRLSSVLYVTINCIYLPIYIYIIDTDIVYLYNGSVFALFVNVHSTCLYLGVTYNQS